MEWERRPVELQAVVEGGVVLVFQMITGLSARARSCHTAYRDIPLNQGVLGSNRLAPLSRQKHLAELRTSVESDWSNAIGSGIEGENNDREAVRLVPTQSRISPVKE